MKNLLLFILALFASGFLHAQILVTPAQVTAINTAQSAASGDIYKDTENNVFYIGTSSGLLKIIGDFSKVDGSLTGDGSVANPLRIAPMGALSGQILSWNGTSWIPVNAAPATTTVTNSIALGQLTTTVNGVSATAVTLPTADGSETKLNNGTNTTVTGAGTTASPYTVSVADATTTAKGVVQLAGDLAGTATSPQIAANAVTTAEILDLTIGTGDVAVGAITSDKIQDATIATIDIGNSQVTYAKIQNVTSARLLGNPTGSAAAPSEIVLGTGLSFSGNVLNSSGSGWSLTGNASTNPTTNFIGTTDNQRLVFRTNNTEKVTILSGGNVGIGTNNPQNKLEITQGTASNSGLRFTNLPNAGILATNSTGDVIIGTDIKDHHISRANSTSNVAPTSLEIPSPVNGYTAKVLLTSGVIEYWSHNGTAWVLSWSQSTTANGVDIGYVVGWTSNITPPDYLLPLNGGTYNWADFPHFQTFNNSFSCQYIDSSNATTFTLININTSGRFLRGGTLAGINQNYSTALPVIPFATSLNTHSHSINYTMRYDYRTNQSSQAVESMSGWSTANTSSDSHSHTLSGGDTETRPINTSVIWCIKVKPTSTTGNITINNTTTSQTVTNLTQNSSTGVITYVNENTISQTARVISANSNNTIKVGNDGGAFYEKKVIDLYNNSASSQVLSTTAATLQMDTIRTQIGVTAFSFSNNTITVNNVGTYRISFSAGITNYFSTSEYSANFWLEKNSVRIPGTSIFQNCYNYSESCGSKSIIIQLVSGDQLRIRMVGSVNNAIQTLPDCSSINIEKLD